MYGFLDVVNLLISSPVIQHSTCDAGNLFMSPLKPNSRHFMKELKDSEKEAKTDIVVLACIINIARFTFVCFE